jgi:HAD superfamily hydrolase (TIGR01484 family)
MRASVCGQGQAKTLKPYVRHAATMMSSAIKLISTDFDGTLYAELESPQIHEPLHRLIAELQSRGTKWVINTGRDLPGILEALGRLGVPTWPDYLILVEREIYQHRDAHYFGLEEWNSACARAHADLFARVRPDLPRLASWISTRFEAQLYEDAYSPFCLVADNNDDADLIHEYLTEYCRGVPDLGLVRNNVYARFHHVGFDKGTALAELSRRLGLKPREVFAAGDWLNDLPMLSSQRAWWLAAPANAVDQVKETVRRQGGFVSEQAYGSGVAQGLRFCLARAAAVCAD